MQSFDDSSIKEDEDAMKKNDLIAEDFGLNIEAYKKIDIFINALTEGAKNKWLTRFGCKRNYFTKYQHFTGNNFFVFFVCLIVCFLHKLTATWGHTKFIYSGFLHHLCYCLQNALIIYRLISFSHIAFIASVASMVFIPLMTSIAPICLQLSGLWLPLIVLIFEPWPSFLNFRVF